MKRLIIGIGIFVCCILLLTAGVVHAGKGLYLTEEQVIKLDTKIRKLQKENELLREQIKNYELLIERQKTLIELYKEQITIYKERGDTYKERLEEITNEIEDLKKNIRRELRKAHTDGLIKGGLLAILIYAVAH